MLKKGILYEGRRVAFLAIYSTVRELDKAEEQTLKNYKINFRHALKSAFLISLNSFAHNYNVAELKQALKKSVEVLSADAEQPSQISSKDKESFGGVSGELFEIHLKTSQAETAGWVFLFEREETPNLISFSKAEKKVKAFLVGKSLIPESEYKDYSFVEKIHQDMLLRFFPKAMREHDHSSMHGGAVLMFLDDHVELSRSSQNQLFAYVSDKKRQSLPLSDFERISFSLLANKKSISLKAEKMKHGSMEMLMLSLPGEIKKDDVLSVSLMRKKGNLITRVIQLSQLPAVKTEDAMSEGVH